MSFDAQSPYGAPTGVGQPAELLERFAARFIDGLIIAVVLVPIVVVLGVAGAMSAGSGWLSSFVSSVTSALLGLGYFAYMESSRGQTVGKMALKLRTIGPDGGNPTLEQAAKRNIWMAASILGIVPFIGSLIGGLAQLAAVITIALGINSNTTTRQAWNDTFAGGTRVIKAG